MLTSYSITGQIKNSSGNGVKDLLVEAFDDDLGTDDDYLGRAFTKPDGKFEITFDQADFKSQYDILERNPDVYLLIRDQYGLVHKTGTRKNASGHDLHFDITLPSTTSDSFTEPYDDPYANAAQIMISQFAAIGDTITVSNINIQRSIPQMLRGINSFLHYTDPRIMKIYRYPGPQVIARPKDFLGHSHVIPWTKQRWEKFGHIVPGAWD